MDIQNPSSQSFMSVHGTACRTLTRVHAGHLKEDEGENREKLSWGKSKAEAGLIRALWGFYLTLISGDLLGGITAAFKTTNRQCEGGAGR